MNNGNKHIDFEELIGKYLSGEAQADEISQLEGWVKESQQNEKTFADLKKLWILSGINAKSSTINVDNEWQILKAKMFTANQDLGFEKEKGKIRTLRPLLRYAAIFIILAVLAGVLFYMLSRPATEELTAINSIITATLPDGSEVTLNLGSKLIYPSKFTGDSRMLELEGDAFFSVTPNKEKPFIVRAGSAEVKVLGTSFYLNAKPGLSSVEVVVSTGKVSFKTGRQEVFLEAGDKGIFNKTKGSLSKEANEDENYISWKTKKLIFNNERLEMVFHKIEQTYGTKIQVLNPEILDCRLTATFDNQPVAIVMEIIEATFGFEISGQNGLVLISGSDCTK
jgi:ferric-dicitrate binding protein FerR (iron transport regulator)